MTNKLDRLQLITTFLAVAEVRSLSAAARMLGTSQPTVSRRLRDLEQLLGARLATRSTHRFDLTAEGERWVDAREADDKAAGKWGLVSDNSRGGA